MPDVTPQETKVKNQLRQSTPAEMEVVWCGNELQFSDVYFKDGLRRDPVYRFSSDSIEVHFDAGTSQFVGVNLVDGSRTALQPQSVKEDRITVSE